MRRDRAHLRRVRAGEPRAEVRDQLALDERRLVGDHAGVGRAHGEPAGERGDHARALRGRNGGAFLPAHAERRVRLVHRTHVRERDAVIVVQVGHDVGDVVGESGLAPGLQRAAARLTVGGPEAGRAHDEADQNGNATFVRLPEEEEVVGSARPVVHAGPDREGLGRAPRVGDAVAATAELVPEHAEVEARAGEQQIADLLARGGREASDVVRPPRAGGAEALDHLGGARVDRDERAGGGRARLRGARAGLDNGGGDRHQHETHRRERQPAGGSVCCSDRARARA